MLHSYSLAVHNIAQGAGALLMAVVGAKLSEGLNFADDLARAVVVVGLPYPNLASTELKERMKYVSTFHNKRSGEGGGRDPGAELYEKSLYAGCKPEHRYATQTFVRQYNYLMFNFHPLGRAIRHRDDWATLILVDARYASQRVRSKLPKWINDGTVGDGNVWAGGEGVVRVLQEQAKVIRIASGTLDLPLPQIYCQCWQTLRRYC